MKTIREKTQELSRIAEDYLSELDILLDLDCTDQDLLDFDITSEYTQKSLTTI